APLIPLLVTRTPHGTLSLNTYVRFTYSPTLKHSVPTRRTSDLNDGQLDSPTNATVSITVTPVNDAPGTSGGVVADDSYTTPEDRSQARRAANEWANETDVDGDPLTAILVTGPAHGTLSLNNDGSFTYTPALNYNGPDSFTYKANDGQLDSPTHDTVSITVTPVNDAPGTSGGVVADDSYTTPEDTTLTVAAPCVLPNDPHSSPTRRSSDLVTGPAHGTLSLNNDGSFTYTPALNYNGPDSFTYKANDGQADSALATVSITITGVNDTPVATNDSATTPEDIAVTITPLVNDSDPDADPLTITNATTTSGTVVIMAGTNLLFTPAPDFNGTATI